MHLRAGLCDDPVMGMTLRFEIFPSDLDEVVDFYTRVLRFDVTKDQRHEPSAIGSWRPGGRSSKTSRIARGG